MANKKRLPTGSPQQELRKTKRSRTVVDDEEEEDEIDEEDLELGGKKTDDEGDEADVEENEKLQVCFIRLYLFCTLTHIFLDNRSASATGTLSMSLRSFW